MQHVLLREDETVSRAVGALRVFLLLLGRRGLHALSVSRLLRLDPPTAKKLPKDSCGYNSTWHK
jgi:hypothetical protein